MWDLTPSNLGESGLRRRGGSGLVGSAPPFFLSVTRPQQWVGWPAVLVEEEGRKPRR